MKEINLADFVHAGAMSNRRSSIVSNENLSAVGVANSIDACIRMNVPTDVVTLKTRATALEAILGAVYLDCGEFEVVRACVRILGL